MLVVTGAGGRKLAEALQTNVTLTACNVEMNRLGDAGVDAMTDALRGNTVLQALNVGWNRYA